MDQQYINSIVDMIESSNLRLRSIEIRPVCYDDDTSLKSTVSIIHSDIIGERSRFVNIDLVANLLIFTAFDGKCKIIRRIVLPQKISHNNQ